MKDENIEKALNYAYRLLGYRDRSSEEMHQRLIKKGFSEKIALDAVNYLKDKGFIDDEMLARRLHRDAIDRKLLGKAGVRNYLLKRGISPRILESLSDNDEEYLEAAKRLIDKRLRRLKGIDAEAVRRRLYGMLLRRGFSYEVINKAIKSISEEDVYEL